MSRIKTEINPMRAERVKKLIERENITQKELAKRMYQTPQNVSRIIQMKQPLTEETAQLIINAFPGKGYRIEYLLGFDDYMTDSDRLDNLWKDAEKKHDNDISTVQYLASLTGIEVKLLMTGTNIDDEILIRKGDEEKIVTYKDVTKLIKYLSALTETHLLDLI